MALPLLAVNLAAKEDDEDAEINSMLGLDSFDLDMDDPVPAPATRKPAPPTTSGRHSTGSPGISSTDMHGSGLMIGGENGMMDGLEGGDAGDIGDFSMQGVRPEGIVVA